MSRKKRKPRKWTIKRRGVKSIVETLIDQNYQRYPILRDPYWRDDCRQATWEMVARRIGQYRAPFPLAVFFRKRVKGAMFDEVRSSRLYGPIRPELAVAPWPYPFWGEAVTHTSGVTPCGRRAMVGPSTGCRHSSRQSVYRDIGTPLKRLLNRERHRLVHVVLPQLIEKHRFVLVQHFWHGRYLKDIGRDLGVTEGRACQLKREALHAFLARWPLPK